MRAQAGDYTRATSLFLQIADATDNSRLKAEAYYSAALSAEAQGETYLPNVREYVSKSLFADPEYAPAYVAQSRLALADMYTTNDPDALQQYGEAALSHLGTALTLNPGLAIGHLQLATYFYAIGQFDDARNVLTHLPDIIDADISLSATEKEDMRSVVENLLASVNESI